VLDQRGQVNTCVQRTKVIIRLDNVQKRADAARISENLELDLGKLVVELTKHNSTRCFGMLNAIFC
jgi:hypothetical protein